MKTGIPIESLLRALAITMIIHFQYLDFVQTIYDRNLLKKELTEIEKTHKNDICTRNEE